MQNLRISIHALLAESDQAANGLANAPPEISIHALLAESDAHTAKNTSIAGHFYPRSPCGERPIILGHITTSQKFLSTLSLRRATTAPTVAHVADLISIHALLAESDAVPLTIFSFTAISIHALLAESDSKSAQNSGALLRI